MVSSISGSMGGLNSSSLLQLKQQMFNKADKNGDGKITEDEMSQLREADGMQDSSSVSSFFEEFDADGDGAINKSESDTAIDQMGQGQQDQGWGIPPMMSGLQMPDLSKMKEEMFTNADQDSDGMITKEEMSQVMEANGSTGSTNGSSVDDFFDEFDTDGDGSINREESDAAIDAMGPPPPPPPPSGSGMGEEASTTGNDAETELLNSLLDALNSGADEDDDSSTSIHDLFSKAIKSYMQSITTSEDSTTTASSLAESLYA